MLTGWGKNKSAAGSTNKRWYDAICMIKNDCSAQNSIKLVDAEQSSNTTYNVRGPKNAIDDDNKSIIHTENEKMGWWRANFNDGAYKVTSVRILNRPDGWGARLGGSTIKVDGKLCGSV